MNTQTPSFRLKEIKFEVTHDCLLNCVHCSSVSKNESGRSMDWTTFNRILDEANEIGVKEVSFSGGEPLLWNNIEDAISRAFSLGIKVFLYTTGNAPNAEKVMLKLYSAGLNRVVFSIFGANSAQHETVTNHKGSYDQTYSIAKYCSNLGLRTEFHFVPLSGNYQILPDIAAMALKIGVNRTSVLRLVPQGRGAKLKNEQLTHSQNIELRDKIKELRVDGHDIRIGSPYNFLMLRENSQCRSGIDRMTIGPDFSIFPCDAFKHISPEAIGQSCGFSNLRFHSLKECWERSPYFGAIRDYLMTEIAVECQTCESLKKCKSGCMAQKFYAYGSLIKGPDPMCFLGRLKKRIA